MKIVVITKRKLERERLQAEEDQRIRREIVHDALAQLVKHDEWRSRVWDVIWRCHDAGQLPAELDSILLEEPELRAQTSR